MANPNFDSDKAARILLDAISMGDRAACDKWQISTRTLVRYRERMNGDNSLAQAVREKKALQDRAWASEIPSAISSCVEFLRAASQEVSKTDPEAIHAVAGSLKILSEVLITREVIDARLAGQDRQDTQEN